MRSLPWLFALATLLAGSTGCTTKQAHAAAPSSPVVVELFTSEGCSSCPPADRVLADVGARPNVIALGFHVDYWDSLGWKDPFSTSAWTDRQRVYASAEDTHGLYTPQMIVDGHESFVGSDHEHAGSAIAATERKPKATVSLALGAKSLRVTYGALPTRAASDVVVVVVAPHEVVDVRAGENSGRRLEHSAVVEQLKIGAPADAKGGALDVALEPSWAGERIVVLLQERKERGIVGAATVAL